MSSHGHGTQSGGGGVRHAGYGWLAFCTIGMMSSFTLYGLALEYTTSGGRKLHEWSFVLVTTSIYSLTAYIARTIFGEKPAVISKYYMLVLSSLCIASTVTSVRSLRYVIYPVQILFKSCKPVPVMIFNIMNGKHYKLVKYVNVIIITAGVALFMGGGNSTHSSSATNDTLLLGAVLLSISLCFDGATGAYEETLMHKYDVGAFDLMYNIQLGKAVISFCVIIIGNGLNQLIETLTHGGFSLFVLGITGAIGQVFVFITISKFGALDCALIGLCRKMLSLILSFLLYGHSINAIQTVGLSLALISMIANFYEKGGDDKSKDHSRQIESEGSKEIEVVEKAPLLDPSDDERDIESIHMDTTLNTGSNNTLYRASKSNSDSDIDALDSAKDLLEFVEDNCSYSDLPLVIDSQQEKATHKVI